MYGMMKRAKSPAKGHNNSGVVLITFNEKRELKNNKLWF